MTSDHVAMIQRLYRAGVKAVDPAVVVPATLRADGSALHVGRERIDVAGRPIYLLAFGKAAAEMTAAAELVLSDALVDGLAVVKDEDSAAGLRSRVVVGSHPVPDQRSLDAGAAVLDFAGSLPAGALVLCLISGGASALLESLRPGVSLDDLQSITRSLLRAGASIHELNAVRARLSNTKAGGLLSALQHASVVNLVISDVLGDDLATIGSGPTVPRRAGLTAEAVLQRFGFEYDLPADEPAERPANPVTHIIGSLGLAIDAVQEEARRAGLNSVVLSRSLSGEASQVATTLASILADSSQGQTSFQPGTCLIAGGETTVTVRGHGTGGRNTEAALAAAIRLYGVADVAAGFLATDGDDAETGAAGGIVTGETLADSTLAEAREALHDNDSFTLLNRMGAIWSPGPTGTNVNDLMIGIVGQVFSP